MGIIRKSLRRGRWLCAVAVTIALVAGGLVVPAQAADESDEELPDVMLAVFTNSLNDSTNSIYMSYDGYNFEKIGEAFVDLTPDSSSSNLAYGSGSESNPFVGDGWSRSYDIYTISCPSIIYHDGYFWMINNESNSGDDGTLRLGITYSLDLVHWSDPLFTKMKVPEGFQNNGTSGQFDAVAADWAVGEDGNIYVVVSIGRYGEYHGEATVDTMYPYLIKITELSASNDPAVDPTKNSYTIVAEEARPIELPSWAFSSNRIDGSLYFEDSTAYLSIKRDGVTNEIWAIEDLNDCSNPDAWTSINYNVVTNYEAPSLTKFNGRYFFLTDELSQYPNYTTGTHMQFSDSIEAASWSEPMRINAYDSSGNVLTNDEVNNDANNGPRHGTIITVTDPDAKKVIWELRESAGWTTDLPSSPIFTDVSTDAWYSTEGWIDYVVTTGLMSGYRDGDGNLTGEFGPNDGLTRGQVATIVYRWANPDSEATTDPGQYATSSGVFSDLPETYYYNAAVEWCYREGIVTGYEDAATGEETGLFGPEDPITREQLATIASRVASWAGIDTTASDTAGFDAAPDRSTVTLFAVSHMAWCYERGILTGDLNTGELMPTDGATRAQAAKIFTVLIRDVLGGNE